MKCKPGVVGLYGVGLLWVIIGGAWVALASGQQPFATGEHPLTVEEVVAAVLRANPQVAAARAQWNSASHQILQNYVPADPTVGYNNIDSWRGIGDPGIHEFTISQPLQFPGKALYQAEVAKRSAHIAQISYEATVRDTRAATETGFYQALLDAALTDVTTGQVADLARVLKVTEVSYESNQAAQTDVISAQVDLSTTRQTLEQERGSARNDLRTLNGLLFRHPESPLRLERKVALRPLTPALDELVDRASARRQEILEAALGQKNSEVAVTLARMEYLPDFSVGYNFDDYTISQFAAIPSHPQEHSILFSFNVPLFSWWHQREDVTKAQYDLEAAADNLGSIRRQTEVAVTQLYDQIQLSYKIALNYRDYLVPLAREDFNVALVAYEGGKIQWPDLSGAMQRAFSTRIAYLQAVNQFLAEKVALEQTVGGTVDQ